MVGPLFPCLRFGCLAVSLSNRCSGSELVCLCVCVCLFVSVSLWVFMGVGGLVCSIIVFSLCEALSVVFKV